MINKMTFIPSDKLNFANQTLAPKIWLAPTESPLAYPPVSPWYMSTCKVVYKPVLVVNLESVVTDNDVVVGSAVDSVDKMQVTGRTQLGSDESVLGARLVYNEHAAHGVIGHHQPSVTHHCHGCRLL